MCRVLRCAVPAITLSFSYCVRPRTSAFSVLGMAVILGGYLASSLATAQPVREQDKAIWEQVLTDWRSLRAELDRYECEVEVVEQEFDPVAEEERYRVALISKNSNCRKVELISPRGRKFAVGCVNGDYAFALNRLPASSVEDATQSAQQGHGLFISDLSDDLSTAYDASKILARGADEYLYRAMVIGDGARLDQESDHGRLRDLRFVERGGGLLEVHGRIAYSQGPPEAEPFRLVLDRGRKSAIISWEIQYPTYRSKGENVYYAEAFGAFPKLGRQESFLPDGRRYNRETFQFSQPVVCQRADKEFRLPYYGFDEPEFVSKKTFLRRSWLFPILAVLAFLIAAWCYHRYSSS